MGFYIERSLSERIGNVFPLVVFVLFVAWILWFRG